MVGGGKGFWERMVQTVKQSLRKIIGQATLQFEELNTLLIEVEASKLLPINFYIRWCRGSELSSNSISMATI